MKPIIHKYFDGGWVCYINKERIYGFGATPMAAFSDWEKANAKTRA